MALRLRVVAGIVDRLRERGLECCAIVHAGQDILVRSALPVQLRPGGAALLSEQATQNEQEVDHGQHERQTLNGSQLVGRSHRALLK